MIKPKINLKVPKKPRVSREIVNLKIIVLNEHYFYIDNDCYSKCSIETGAF